MTRDAKRTSVTFLVMENPKTLSFVTTIHHKTSLHSRWKFKHEADKYSNRSEHITGIEHLEKFYFLCMVEESYVEQVEKANG
jgi:hypothetical protein